MIGLLHSNCIAMFRLKVYILTCASCLTAIGEQLEWIWGAMETQPWRRCFLWTQGQYISDINCQTQNQLNSLWSGKYSNAFCAFADWHQDQRCNWTLPPVCNHSAGLPVADPLQPDLCGVSHLIKTLTHRWVWVLYCTKDYILFLSCIRRLSLRTCVPWRHVLKEVKSCMQIWTHWVGEVLINHLTQGFNL